jgi:hypothetical protein
MMWIQLPLLDLTDVAVGTLPGRGTTYRLNLAGHDIQLYVTEKRKLVRVFVDHRECKRGDR